MGVSNHSISGKDDPTAPSLSESVTPSPVAISTSNSMSSSSPSPTMSSMTTATATTTTSAKPDPSSTSAENVTAAEKERQQRQQEQPRKKKLSKREEEQEDMAWICAECKEAECSMIIRRDTDGDDGHDDDDDDVDDFLFCDGVCGRIFHFPCAGLRTKPSNDDDEEWLCRDCSQNTHACAYCNEYGQDNVDVFACKEVAMAACGLFFHEACLQSNGIDYTYAETAAETKRNEKGDAEYDSDDDDDDEIRIPVFTCPSHHCWVCTQPEMVQFEMDEVEEQRKAAIAAGKRPKKKPKKGTSMFQTKPACRLFRCLVCPLAYHVSCIPPAAKFHELAVLCHEHADSHKLPDLDLESSMQMQVEDKIDEKLDKSFGVRRRRAKPKSSQSFWNKFRRGPNSNPFFPGLRGDKLNTPETTMLNSMERVTEEFIPKSMLLRSNNHDSNSSDDNDDFNGNNDDMDVDDTSVDDDNTDYLPNTFSQLMDGNLPFCVPIDLKDEAFSKPPMYTHIPSNKVLMSSIAKPKKVPGSNRGEQEKCTCSGKSCSPSCYNRVTMSECTGPHNCNVWEKTKDCGNRALSRRQFAKCIPQREAGRGWGLVTLQSIQKGQLVQEYVGEIIDEKEKELRLSKWNVEHPNDPNFYVMALGTGYYVDARVHGNQSRFINHSCDPNTRVATINVKGSLRNGIYATRDIKAGEFLCYDYHFDTKNGDMFRCRCGSNNCRGTMKERRNATVGGDGNQGKNKKELWKEAKERYDKDVRFLQETQGVTSLVGHLVPGAEHEGETVATGPQRRETETKVFLFRNARLGADFVSRKSRLER